MGFRRLSASVVLQAPTVQTPPPAEASADAAASAEASAEASTAAPAPRTPQLRPRRPRPSAEAPTEARVAAARVAAQRVEAARSVSAAQARLERAQSRGGEAGNLGAPLRSLYITACIFHRKFAVAFVLCEMCVPIVVYLQMYVFRLSYLSGCIFPRILMRALAR